MSSNIQAIKNELTRIIAADPTATIAEKLKAADIYAYLQELFITAKYSNTSHSKPGASHKKKEPPKDLLGVPG